MQLYVGCLCRDDQFPTYYLNEFNEEFGHPIDLSEDQWDEYSDVAEAYERWQRTLEDVYNEGEKVRRLARSNIFEKQIKDKLVKDLKCVKV
jgi:hypothetical protein